MPRKTRGKLDIPGHQGYQSRGKLVPLASMGDHAHNAEIQRAANTSGAVDQFSGPTINEESG